MAYTYDPIFAQDPNNPNVVASNAAITIYDPADPGKNPISITDPTGSPLPNPITVDARGMGSAFQHPTLDRVAWTGAGLTNYFTSYEGMKNEAKAAKEAAQSAQESAATAGAGAAAAAASALAGAVADAEAAQAAAESAAALVGAPADAAIAAAVNGNGATKAALSATYALLPDNGAKPVGKGEQTLNVKDFGAVGDGTVNDTTALQTAVNAAITQRLPLYIPKGTFKANATILANGSINIYGPGTIRSDHVTGAVLKVLNAATGSIRDITLLSTATIRDAVNAGLEIRASTEFTVSGITVKGSASAGMFIQESSRISISDCTVRDTLADGIHITRKSSLVSVIGCKVYNPADDGIAVVSYTGDGGTCTDVTVVGNCVTGGKARGIAVAGGERVTVLGNTIKTTSSSGVILVQDTNYGTYVATDVVVSGNTITDAGQNLPRIGNQFGIEVGGGVVKATVSGNLVRNAYQKGISTISPAVTISGNTVTLSNGDGISISASQVPVIGNGVHDSAKYGIVTAASGLSDINISNNTVSGSNTSSTAGVDGINVGAGGSVINPTVIGNNVIDTAGKTERAIEVTGTNGTMYGNSATGVIFINVVGGSGMRVGPLSGTTVPSSTYYAAGTQYMKTDTSTLYMFNGSAWKSVALV